MRERVVVTGLGAVAPNGVGVPAFTAALRRGESGIRPLRFRDERLKSGVAAECVAFDPGSQLSDADLSRVPRLIPLALAAAREACSHARLVIADAMPAELSRRIGLVLGTGGGGIDFTLRQAERAHHGKLPSLWTITNATHGNLAGELSIRLGLRGPSLCVSTGCASSSDAAGLALELLRSERPGSPDAFLVLGADSHVVPGTLLGMELLGVITTSRTDPPAAASRPFDRTRDGFVLGEGAWAMLLERESFARRREARPLARLLGYGVTCDAFHRVRPAPDMEESARAIRLAAEDAALAPEEIGLVHYHGTSTRLNDSLETLALKLAFGPHAPRLRGTSVKSMIGHPQGACGMAACVASLASLLALDGGGPFIPPTLNLREPDPACDLDYTPNESRLTDARTLLVNCLAFGAKNSALVFRALDPVR